MKRLAEDKRVRRIYSDSASDSDHSSVKRDKKDPSVIMPKAATAGNTPNELNWSNSSVVRVFPHHYIYVRDLTTNVTRLEVGPQTFVRKDNEQVSTCTHLLSKQVSQAFFHRFCGNKHNIFSETLSLGDKSLSLGNILEFRRNFL